MAVAIQIHRQKGSVCITNYFVLQWILGNMRAQTHASELSDIPIKIEPSATKSPLSSSEMTFTQSTSSEAQSQSASDNIVIQVRDLRKSYKEIVAVDGISFEVQRGEIFGMLGPNGAGKTTTVEILEGLRDLDSGEAHINGLDVTKNTTRVKSIIGVQLQQNAFFDNLNLKETIELFATLYGSDMPAEEALEKVDLAERAKVSISDTSPADRNNASPSPSH